MKANEQPLGERLIYIGLVLLTLGGVYFWRVVSTHAIRKAFQE